MQSKKKNETVHEVSIVYKFPLVPLDNSDISDVSAACPVTVPARQGHSNGNANNVRKSNRVKENGSANGLKKIYGRKDENDYETKLSELKGTISNADKFAKQFQGGKAGHVESIQSDHRVGTRRRKSGSVKRFKQDLSSSGSNLSQNVTPNIHVGYGATDAQIEVENLGLTVDGLNHRALIDNYVNVPVITKIVKPVGFSSSVSDNTQDVSVNFLAIRSVFHKL